MSKESKESLEQTQQPSSREGIELSEEQKQELTEKISQIDQRIEEIKSIRTDEDKWNKLEDVEAQALFDEYTKIKDEKERLQRKLEGKEDDEFWDKERELIRNVRFKKVVDKKAPLRPAPGHKFHHGIPSSEKVSYISRHAGRPLVVLTELASPRELDTSKTYNVRVLDERPNKITVLIIE
jgi:hypothetical protein